MKVIRDRPILFSTPMVQSLAKGWKTQTRRMTGFDWLNKRPNDFTASLFHANSSGDLLAGFRSKANPAEIVSAVGCPYGKAGDLLWVRETWAPDVRGGFYYKANDKCFDGKWKPSIHMPKSAARTWLKITDVRIEQIQEISPRDAISEGIERLAAWPEAPDKPRYRWYGLPGIVRDDQAATFDPVLSFFTLWAQINGEDSVLTNPWVWIVEFEKTEAPSLEADCFLGDITDSDPYA